MRRTRLLLSLIALAASCAGAAAQTESPYIRVVDTDDDVLRLDIAVRTLTPSNPEDPVVHLVGAVHIADAPFYAHMQSFLDVHDVVLYEGVGGARASVPEPEARDEAAAVISARRVMFLAMLSQMLALEHGEEPRAMDDLAEAFGGSVRGLVREASRDGWGRKIKLTPDGPVSLGADGRVGGEGLDSDLHGAALLADPPEMEPDPAAAGLQRDLADALGLTFQLDKIDYTRPHWRNSDMQFFEIHEALGVEPRDQEDAGPAEHREPDPDASPRVKAAEALFQTLSGESFMAKASGFLLRMVGSSPQGRAIVKIMLAETLVNAETLLKAQSGPMADLMEVILNDRNRVVVADLRRLLADEPEVETVAIFYGAGHFGDLESRIIEEFGYELDGTIWVPAISVDLADTGMSAAQINGYRSMMRTMIEAQLRAAQQR